MKLKNPLKLDPNSIEEKWNTNWCKKYWKFAHYFIIHDYGVEKKNIENTPFHSIESKVHTKIYFW